LEINLREGKESTAEEEKRGNLRKGSRDRRREGGKDVLDKHRIGVRGEKVMQREIILEVVGCA
jgi:hypothetical protein